MDAEVQYYVFHENRRFLRNSKPDLQAESAEKCQFFLEEERVKHFISRHQLVAVMRAAAVLAGAYESHFMGSRHRRPPMLQAGDHIAAKKLKDPRQDAPAKDDDLLAQKIGRHHRGHSKSHLDSYLALMTVILQALLGNLHGSGSRGEYEVWRLISGWIEEQE